MGDRSKIEWTDASWNPIRARHTGQRTDPRYGRLGWHCTHVSEGCRNCYAEVMNRRLGTGFDYKPGHEKDIEIFLDEKMLLQPLRWRKPRKIFVGSMSDIGAHFVTDAMLDKIFAVAALTPRHTYQFLTKRPDRWRGYFTHDGGFGRWGHIEHQARHIARERGMSIPSGKTLATFGGKNMPNCWFGTSCENQPTADERMAHLRATPAVVRFISFEPLLSPITADLTDMHWAIVGGESGPHARPMHPDWARSLRDQCAAASVPFFFKQWGEWELEIDRDHDDPDWRKNYHVTGNERAARRILNLAGGFGFHGERVCLMHRVGKKNAGRKLDGVEHNGMPGARG